MEKKDLQKLEDEKLKMITGGYQDAYTLEHLRDTVKHLGGSPPELTSKPEPLDAKELEDRLSKAEELRTRSGNETGTAAADFIPPPW